jgi:hypothetical protein
MSVTMSEETRSLLAIGGKDEEVSVGERRQRGCIKNQEDGSCWATIQWPDGWSGILVERWGNERPDGGARDARTRVYKSLVLLRAQLTIILTGVRRDWLGI